jgi:hypothetical protein
MHSILGSNPNYEDFLTREAWQYWFHRIVNECNFWIVSQILIFEHIEGIGVFISAKEYLRIKDIIT